MSNPEKTEMDTEGDINENSDESEYLWSDEEEEIRELVCALPALRVSEHPNVDELIRNEAFAAAQLIVEAAKEAVVGNTDQTVSGSRDFGVNPNTTNISRPRVLIESLAGASGSTAIVSTEEEETIKKGKRKSSSILTHPPPGPPTCNICGKLFISWKAVFGHLRSHKDRGYLGFHPPPTFDPSEERFGGSVGAASYGGGGLRLGTGVLDIDLNADPQEEEEERSCASGSTPTLDLNRSPPQVHKMKKKRGRRIKPIEGSSRP